MLRLAKIRHTTFQANPDRPDLDGLTHLFNERCAPYEIDVRIDAPLTGNRNSFSRMSERVLVELGGEPDLVVLGHAVPDCDLSVSVNGYLQQRVMPKGLVFAISGQGRTTGFAALRAAWAMAHGGGHRRVAMLALDQTTIPFPDPQLAGMDPHTDHAVGLLFTPEGRIRVTAPPPVPGVAPDQIASVVRALAEEVCADICTQRTVVVSDSVAAHAGAGLSNAVARAAGPGGGAPGAGCRLRRASPGRWCTAVWSELAQELADPCAAGRAVIAIEYDPALRYLGMAVFGVPAGGHVPSRGDWS